MREIWKPVVGYKGWYEVNNYGDVKRVKSGQGSVVGRILKARNHNGYLAVTLTKKGNEKTQLVHRLVALAFIINPENKPEVNHKDSIRNNPKVSNLEWVTSRENKQHAIRVLGAYNGELNGGAKLNENQVIIIKEMLRESDMFQREIGEIFGVSRSQIAKIKLNLNWKHIK